MSELAWILVGNTVFVTVAATAACLVMWKSLRNALESKDADKKLLYKLLKDAQDRIHAASLSDYMAIRGGGDRPAFESISRSDEQEAEIEARMGGGL